MQRLIEAGAGRETKHLQTAIEYAKGKAHQSIVVYLRSFTGWSALHYACHMDDVVGAARLLHEGADPLLENEKGVSPFMLALLNDSKPTSLQLQDMMKGAVAPWCPESHALFPPAHRRHVFHLMLTQQRLSWMYSSDYLPVELWISIISFMPKTWHSPGFAA